MILVVLNFLFPEPASLVGNDMQHGYTIICIYSNSIRKRFLVCTMASNVHAHVHVYLHAEYSLIST